MACRKSPQPGESKVSRKAVNNSAILLAVALAQCHVSAYAQASCKVPAGRFASLSGTVQVRGDTQPDWRAAKPADRLCTGDSIRVGELSRAAIVLANETVMRLDQNTTMRLVDIRGKPEERSLIELLKGAIQSFVRKPRLLSVNTPYLNGSIEGTEFQARVEDNRASILVLEGRVVASNGLGNVATRPGELAEAQANSAPTAQPLARPRDAVQWSLYYPPILASTAGTGDIAASFAGMEKVAECDRDAAYYLKRASLLLSAGRQKEAQKDIDAALRLDPETGLAHALRAITYVVRNDRDEALSESGQAIALSGAAAPRIALSYAQQAEFRNEAARDTLLDTVRNHPRDALAWSRLSELWFMLGDRAQALDAAARALALAPELARPYAVQGFDALAGFRRAEAETRFRRAIELSPSDPLGHLGLGLTRIGAGQLAEGRGELEVAVALDSSQALLRAYLGKAYFDERRSPLDAQQFEIATQLDPGDPTAYLYDALSKPSQNRPVEALAELEKAIALNQNRVPYRGRLLLDTDRAVNGTSLARVYNDLGFVQQGMVRANTSLALDPANAAAHRFLSDVYRNERRRDSARLSEMLQAQMLQDINVNPIQPSASEAALNLPPDGAGFHEFTPLLQRNHTRLDAALLGGDAGTRGIEASLTGMHERVSFGLGALTYETDGWRPNNGLEQDLFNVFAQAALTERLNVSAGFSHRKSTEGDLAFNFDPADYLLDQTIVREQDTARLGLRYTPAAGTQLLLAYAHSQRDDTLHAVETIAPVAGVTTRTTNRRQNGQSDQVEAQWLHAITRGQLMAGAAWHESDRVDDVGVSIDDTLSGNLGQTAVAEALPTEHAHAYAYSILPGAGAIWTLGVSLDRFEHAGYEDRSVNPKLGVQWAFTPAWQLRAAALRTIKPALADSRTLEPTQLAGFNQLFDDPDGAASQRYALGLDGSAGRNLKAGAEFSYRLLDEPVFDPARGYWITEAREEQWHRLYLDWTPTARLALHGELAYDLTRSDAGVATAAGLPETVETWSLPVALNYFDPSGFFAGVAATWLDQSVRRAQSAGDDRFVVVDATLGYRLPGRRGVLSLAVKNLFDTGFSYQDDSYREFGDAASIGPYFPQRMITARLTLNF
jgi:tetratricopeptide (TPR) repeat protein